MQSIKQHNTSDELYIVLVGNKIDKEADRVVKTEEGKAMADSFGIRFYECSASASGPPPAPPLLPLRAPTRRGHRAPAGTCPVCCRALP